MWKNAKFFLTEIFFVKSVLYLVSYLCIKNVNFTKFLSKMCDSKCLYIISKLNRKNSVKSTILLNNFILNWFDGKFVWLWISRFYKLMGGHKQNSTDFRVKQFIDDFLTKNIIALCFGFNPNTYLRSMCKIRMLL